MLDYILKLFKDKFCTHKNVVTEKSLSYCPDCGKLIHINWYVIRCACCGKKRMGILRGNKVVPIANFCTNCGHSDYDVEKIENLNYFNMYYAIAKKEEELTATTPDITESWVDEVEAVSNLRFLIKKEE